MSASLLFSSWPPRLRTGDGSDDGPSIAATLLQRVPFVPLAVVALLFSAIFFLLRVTRTRVVIPEPRRQDAVAQGGTTKKLTLQFGAFQSVALFLMGRNPSGAGSGSPLGSNDATSSSVNPAGSNGSNNSSSVGANSVPWINHLAASICTSRRLLQAIEDGLNRVLKARAEALETTGLAHTVVASFRLLSKSDDASDPPALGNASSLSSDRALQHLPLRLHSMDVLHTQQDGAAFKLLVAVEFAIGDVEAPSHHRQQKERETGAPPRDESDPEHGSDHCRALPFDIAFELSAHVAVALGRFLPVSIAIREVWGRLVKLQLTIEATPQPTVAAAAAAPPETKKTSRPQTTAPTPSQHPQQQQQRPKGGDRRDPESNSNSHSRNQSPALGATAESRLSPALSPHMLPAATPQWPAGDDGQRSVIGDARDSPGLPPPSMRRNSASDDSLVDVSFSQQQQLLHDRATPAHAAASPDTAAKDESSSVPPPPSSSHFLPQCVTPFAVRVAGRFERIGDAEFELRTCIGPSESLFSLRDWWLLQWVVQKQARSFVDSVLVPGRSAAQSATATTVAPAQRPPLFQLELTI